MAGIPKLNALGFEHADRLQIHKERALRQLMLIQLSYGYRGLLSNVTANMDQFMDDLATELSCYLRDGNLESVLINWALIFNAVPLSIPSEFGATGPWNVGWSRSERRARVALPYTAANRAVVSPGSGPLWLKS